MIAPTTPPREKRPRSERLRRVHRMLADRFLPLPGAPEHVPKPIPGWQAWLFTAWVVVVVSAYFYHMLVPYGP